MSHPGDLLSAYLDGELDAAEHAGVATHLSGCAGCRRELADTTAGRAALRSLPMVDAPAALAFPPARPRAMVRALRPAWAWAAASAAALALVVGLAFGPGARPSPMDLDTLADRHTARLVVQPGVQTVRAVLETP